MAKTANACLQRTLMRIPKVDLAIQRCDCYFFPVWRKCNSQQVVPMLQHFEAAWGADMLVSHRTTQN